MPPDADEEQWQREQQARTPGALPSASQTLDWSALWRGAKRNLGLWITLVGIFGLLVIASIWLATRALHTVPEAQAQSAPLPGVVVTPGSHTPEPPPGTPLDNSIATDVNGNPLQKPTANGNSTPGAQQQQQVTPAQQRAQNLQAKMDDAMWKAREAKPDASARLTSSQTAPTPQTQSTQQPSPDPAKESGDPVIASNTCGADKGTTYHLVAGISLIKARLLNAITSEAKGPVLAEVVEPTRNFDMTRVLIPKGAYVIGHSSKPEELDQERMLLAIDRIVMPDGCQISFHPIDVMDQTGMSGLRDQVNHHYAQIFLTSIAIAGVGASAQFGGQNTGYGYSPVDALRIGFGAGASQASQQVMSRYARRPTTLTIRSGQEITLFPPVDIPVGIWSDHRVHAAL